MRILLDEDLPRRLGTLLVGHEVSTVQHLPGCIAAADTEAEVKKLIREAIEFHIEGLWKAGEPVPEPSSASIYVEVEAA